MLSEPLPPPKTLGDIITFHTAEIEELIELDNDTVLDVKVLPDKSAWLMSHFGMAKELAAILDNPLKVDLPTTTEVSKKTEKIKITITSPACDFYSAALVTGVKVGPSPKWLTDRLQAVGQRSINNIVDATNYVMFELGQPLHAFDADKLGTHNGYHIVIRQAKAGEKITTLTGDERELSTEDTLIVDGVSDTPIGIAGVKGGAVAAVDESTTSLIIESAHFNRFAVRRTARNLKLPTDAAKRYENGICNIFAPLSLNQVITYILKVAGGEVVGSNQEGQLLTERKPVTVSIKKINSVLGLALTAADITKIFDRFAYSYALQDDLLTVNPSLERDDLVLPEDLIEEVGRMYGLEHIVSVAPIKREVSSVNKRFAYGEKIRAALISLGFSEIYTSSFRAKDEVALANALASDKGYLRSSLFANLIEARQLNSSHRDLLGLSAVKLFEIGTVFSSSAEEFNVGLTIQTGTTYKAKIDDTLLQEALDAITATLGVPVSFTKCESGTAEFSLDALLPLLPPVTKYDDFVVQAPVLYQSFSLYPAMTRDIALWVAAGVSVATVQEKIGLLSGPLCVRLSHLDTFTKDGRTSLAFRLVFQSTSKTLTDEEVNGVMTAMSHELQKQGWEVR